MTNRLLRVRDAADQLGIQEKTLRNWIYEGRIEYVKVLGGSIRIGEGVISRIITEGTRPSRKR